MGRLWEIQQQAAVSDARAPRWVISSTAPGLIGADTLMSGAGAWSALLSLTPPPHTPPPPLKAPTPLPMPPFLSICPLRTVQIRPNVTLYGLVSSWRSTRLQLTVDSSHWQSLYCLEYVFSPLLFCGPFFISIDMFFSK